MNALASAAVVTAGLTAALLAGCSSSAGDDSAATTPPPVATTTVTAAAPSTGDAVAGSSIPTEDSASSPAEASSTHTSSQGSGSESGSFKAFIGTWDGHGRTLTVDKDGGFTMDFRTYRNCSSTVTTGCDRTSGNTLIDGGHVKGMITHVYNASTVIVTVFSSTDKRDVPETSFTLGHDVTHHALAARVGPFAKNAPFCGSGAPDGYCGA